MPTLERSRRRVHLWSKAMFHFSLCFTLGFLSGLSLLDTGRVGDILSGTGLSESRSTKLELPGTVENAAMITVSSSRRWIEDANLKTPKLNEWESTETVRAIKGNDSDITVSRHVPLLNESGLWGSGEFEMRRPLIIVTPMISNHPLQRKYLRTLGHALKLVPPPLLWIVVTPQTVPAETVGILRRSGVMYRHLVCRQNLASRIKLIGCQRNLALDHIEHYRLNGIVHFADVFNVYSLRFFEEIRQTGVFSTWPIAFVHTNKNRMDLTGPVCRGSGVVGWHAPKNSRYSPGDFAANPSGFAFNSTILWDPERWGRVFPTPNPPQKVSLIHEAMAREQSKIQGLAATGCTRVLVWRLRLHSLIPKNQVPQ